MNVYGTYQKHIRTTHNKLGVYFPKHQNTYRPIFYWQCVRKDKDSSSSEQREGYPQKGTENAKYYLNNLQIGLHMP